MVRSSSRILRARRACCRVSAARVTSLARGTSDLLRDAAARPHGVEVESQEEQFLLCVPYARDAVLAAAEGGACPLRHEWDGPSIKARMVSIPGSRRSRKRLRGLDVHRAAASWRSRGTGAKSFSARTTDLVTQELPDSIAIRKLGVFQLKDFGGGETLTQLAIKGFPPRSHLSARRRSQHRPLVSFRVSFANASLVRGRRSRCGRCGGDRRNAPIKESCTDARARRARRIERPHRKGYQFGAGRGYPLGRHRSGRIAVGCEFGRSDRLACRPLESRVVRTLSVPGTPVGVAVGGGSIWVVNSDLAATHSTITRIDERYQRVTATIPLPSTILIGSGAGITWDGHNIWTVTQAGNAFRISSRSNRVTASVSVGRRPDRPGRCRRLGLGRQHAR